MENVSFTEKRFFLDIQELLAEWVSNNSIVLNESQDEYSTIEISEQLFREFLLLDESGIEQLHLTNSEIHLISYFHKYLSENNLIFFVMYIIHLVIEENIILLFTRFECTGSHYGHWATAELRDGKLHKTINKRIVQLQYNFELAKYYKNLFESSKSSVLESQETETVHEEAPDLFKLLVGTSGATLIFGGLLRFALNKSALWKSSDNNTQVMFTLGSAPGSVKLYGFCLEKEKPSPRPDSRYQKTSTHEIEEQTRLSFERIPFFIKYLIELLRNPGNQVMELARLNSAIVWHHLQLIFWLVTQEYKGMIDEENAWKDFILRKRREVTRIDGVELGLDSELQKEPYLVTLTMKSIEILQKIEGAIFELNSTVIENLISNLNEED